jgi:type IV pilus assembly protein PilY1
MFQSSYDTTDGWTGDVKAYHVRTDYTGECAGKSIGDIIRSSHVWSAAEALDSTAPNSRIIATYNPSTGSGIPFRWASLTTGVGSQQALLGTEDVLNYVRGDDSNEELNGGTYRDRYSKLGDIVHSSPIFENGVLYTGGNDGMLHAFAASDDEPYVGAVGGEELFAYVPNLVFDHLSDLTDPNYTHKYYVDLTPTVESGVNIYGDLVTPVSTTLLVGGLGKGGRGYFALDVTDPAAITTEALLASKVMWEFPSGADDDMGYSFSKSAIVESNDPTAGSNGWIVIFGNGYNSPNGKAVLYIVNPGNGNVIRKIDTNVSGCNGLSTPVPVDVDYDDKVDYVYAGDLRGNMWKFDLRDPNHANWEIAFEDGTDQALFAARGPGGTTQSITAKPDVMYHPLKHGYMVLFGTGRFLGLSDLDDETVQSLYGIWDYGDDGDDDEYLGTFQREDSQKLSNQPSTVKLLEQGVIPAPSGPNAPDFWTVTLTDGAGNPYDLLLRLTTNNPITWETVSDIDGVPFSDPLDDLSNTTVNHAGWFFDLPVAGEKATVDAMIRDGNLIAISYVPDDTPCSTGGFSVVHEMSAQSGARLTVPQFDINGDGVIDNDDMINIETDPNKAPIWVAPTGVRKAGQLQPPAILIDGGAGVEIKYFSSSTGDIEQVKEKSAHLGISHWREYE